MPRLSPFSLEGLRSALRPEYAGMPAADLEQLIEGAIEELPEGSAENVLGALGSIGRTVAPVLQKAAPAMAQGAASGATVGGPWGAVIGAGAGLASSAMSGAARRPAAAAGAAPAPATAATLPGGQGAAGTLLSLMQNPAVQQALMSQVMGAAGAPSVTAATGAQIPRGAVNNLLMQLLASASEALDESDEAADESYLRDRRGAYVADPASPEQQAAVVLAHLQTPGAEYAEDFDWIGEDTEFTEDVEFY